MGEQAYYYIVLITASQGKLVEARNPAERAIFGKWRLDKKLRFAISADEIEKYMAPGKSDKAKKMWRAAARLDPDNAQVQKLLDLSE